MSEPRATLEAAFRSKSGEVFIRLLRQFGVERFALVEEAVQTAYLRALERWPSTGVPDNPGGWLYSVAKNAVLESLRRLRTEERTSERFGRERESVESPTEPDDTVRAVESLDDLAEMVLLCCNPDLSERAQVCLTLKAACGLSTQEIARLLGMEQETAKKTITRARAGIAERPDVFRELRGDRVSERFRAVLETIYGVFTAGYAASRGLTSLRKAAAHEAVRLAEVLSESTWVPDGRRGELEALRALMLLHLARFEARVDSSGVSVRLEEQDRSLWDRGMIAAGLRALERSMRSPRLTAYHLEARIAAEHSTSPSFGATRWDSILQHYDRLLELKDTPAVRLNRIVAVRYASGPARALVELDELTGSLLPVATPGSSQRHAVRADILEALGRNDEALASWKDAVATASTHADRESLRRRAERTASHVPDQGGAASTDQEVTP